MTAQLPAAGRGTERAKGHARTVGKDDRFGIVLDGPLVDDVEASGPRPVRRITARPSGSSPGTGGPGATAPVELTARFGQP